MLAILRHRTAAFAVEIGEPAMAEIQLNFDAIDIGSTAPHLGADVREIVAELEARDASLGLIRNRLLERRTAEEGIDLLLLQYIRECESHIHDGEDLLHQEMERRITAALLPLYGPWRLARHVVHHPVDALDFVDDPGGRLAEKLHVERIKVC